MWRRIKQLKKLWALTGKDETALKRLELLERDDLYTIPEYDGQAEFLSDMDQEEYEDYVRKEERGWRTFYNLVDKITNGK